MRRLFVPLILSASLSVVGHPAKADQASNSGAKAPDLKMTPEIKELLQSMAKMFEARDGLASFHVEYLSRAEMPDAEGHASLSTLTVTGDLEKPNKMNLRLMHAGQYVGQVVSDGVTTTYYDPKSNRYASFPAQKSYDDVSLTQIAQERIDEDKPGYKRPENDPVSLQKAQRKSQEDAEAAAGVFEDLPGLSDVVEAAGYLLRKTSDGDWNDLGAALGQIKRSKKKLPGSGRMVDVIDLSNSIASTGADATRKQDAQLTIEARYAFDSLSGLPQEYRSANIAVVPGMGRQELVSDYTYTSIVLASAPYPASAFAWSAPAGAKVYEKPKETDPFAETPK